MHEVYQEIAKRSKEIHILVVGDVMLDEYVWGKVSRISPEAPVPIVLTSGTSCVLGGAANVANNLRALGCQVSLMGIVGQDEPASSIFLDQVERAEIEWLGMRIPGRPTIRKSRIVAHGQQLLRIDHEQSDMIDNPCAAWLVGILNGMETKDAIIFSDYSKGMWHQTLFSRLATMAYNWGIPFLVDPKGKQWHRYRGATAITPNEEELGVIVGRDSMDDDKVIEAADAIDNLLGYQQLLVTQGVRGMTLFQGRSGLAPIQTIIPITHPRTIFDVSGAGDTVMAVFALGLAMQQDPIATAALANLAAGIVVGKLGTSTASLTEIRDALASPERTY